MPTADTANFNRFLTSVGLLLIAVSLVIPYFYFSNTDLLEIPRKELHGLTAEGRVAIRRRQNAISDLEKPILGLAGALLLGGGVCLFTGGRRLRKLQGKEDAAIDRQAQRETVEIKQLTEAERDERRDEQARAVVRTTSPPAGFGLQESRQAIDRTEARLAESFEREDFACYRFLSDVKIVGEGGRQELAIEGLFSSSSADRPDVVMALKLVVQDPAPELEGYVEALLATLARYQHLTGRRAVGWLLIVPSREADVLNGQAREDLRVRFEEEMDGLGHASILREDELVIAPAHFRAMFAPADALEGQALSSV